MEVQETDKEKDGVAPKPKMVHYYYISYQQFVNVVKYKLDQMRKKLESEDKMVNSIVVPINLLLLLLLLLLLTLLLMLLLLPVGKLSPPPPPPPRAVLHSPFHSVFVNFSLRAESPTSVPGVTTHFQT